MKEYQLEHLLGAIEEKGLSIARAIEIIRSHDEACEKSEVVTMNIGHRTYEILSFLQENEISVGRDTVINRAKKIGANITKDDGQYLLSHQVDIPTDLRGKVVFAFPDWHHSQIPRRVCYVIWSNDQWIQKWFGRRDSRYDKNDRLIRRKNCS